MHEVKKLDSALELSGASQGVQEGLRDVRKYLMSELSPEISAFDHKELDDHDPTFQTQTSRILLRDAARRASKGFTSIEKQCDISAFERLNAFLFKFTTAIDHFDSYTDRESNASLLKVQTAYWVRAVRFIGD